MSTNTEHIQINTSIKETLALVSKQESFETSDSLLESIKTFENELSHLKKVLHIYSKSISLII